MPKLLIVTSSYFFVRLFLIPHVKHLTENGWVVHIASNNDGTTIPYVHKQIDIPIKQSPYHTDNLSAISKLKSVMREGGYDIVHCHTPTGAMVTRLAAKNIRKELGFKVIYTVHGLRFHKNAKIINWILYFNVEKFLARYTDAIISINNEDRDNIKKYFPEIPYQYSTPGIGYDMKHVGSAPSMSKQELRKKYSVKEDDFVCLFLARLVAYKNHKFIINNIKEIKRYIPNIKFLFVGDGDKMKCCKKLARKLRVEDSIIFFGHQLNITDYLHMSDIGVTSSIREGLPMGLVEGMATALPFVASDIRGHCDLIEHGKNGLLYKLNDTQDFIKNLTLLYNNPDMAHELGKNAQAGIGKYAVENIIPMITAIYDDVMK